MLIQNMQERIPTIVSAMNKEELINGWSILTIYQATSVPNPLWDDALNSRDVGNSFGVRNNLNAGYRPFSFLTFRGRAGINKSTSETEVFYSPDATRFDDVDILRKGSYRNSESVSNGFSGDLTATYGQLFADVHMVNIVAGTSLNQRESITKGFEAEGFPEGNSTTPAFSNSYPSGSKPTYRDSKTRNVGFFLNSGYAFKSKYLVDLNLRSDGTSVFGSNRLFSTTWSAGLAWNIHNESFMRRYDGRISMFKLQKMTGCEAERQNYRREYLFNSTNV